MAVPKGTRIGGRQKGTPNKVTAETTAKIAAAGITPLDYMLTILRDTKQNAVDRFEAAKAAAPYVHARLNATTLKGDEDAPIKHTFEWLSAE